LNDKGDFYVRVDLYTKTVLTMATLLLALIAFRNLVIPPNARAAATLDGVQFAAANNPAGLWAIDTRTGKIWLYVMNGYGSDVRYMGALRELGKSLEGR